MIFRPIRLHRRAQGPLMLSFELEKKETDVLPS